ncbi:MAG: cpaF1 [Anaerocolumna sp.]|jgi:pilus assembly protein CpaF|nr:cpaF1 [Anaerocolumna sp.]
MDFITNVLLITLILLIITISFYYIYKKDDTIPDKSKTSDVLSLEYLINGIKETFNQILNASFIELNLNKEESIKQEKRKAKLRKELRSCNCGDIGAKEYIKEYIKDLIQIKYHVNEQNIDQIIPFHNEKKLTPQDKFEILLYLYKKLHGLNALDILINTYELDKKYNPLSNNENPNDYTQIDTKEDGYYERDDIQYANSENVYMHLDNQYGFKIIAEQIEHAYSTEIGTLSFADKLEIVTQRIYQLYKGHGVIDEIRDMNIDGVSAGVSGLSNVFYHYTEDMLTTDFQSIPPADNSIWIFYHGKTIHLSFLGFGSRRELERVCKNIYRYDNPGQLSSAKGYIANEMKDGSRVIVVRPPLTENWAFFIRKFDSINKVDAKSLITDQDSDVVIETMKWLIKGCQVIGITGEQGCGKTTLLKALVEYINPVYTLRIQELIFELNLRKLYPYRNILSFKETSTVSGQDALDLQKKTDGTVTILGEVATAPVARWLVQLSQVASKFTIFTHHAKTTNNLIMSLRNALLQEGGFHNEMVAEEQVVDTVNFDIHMVKTAEGHRYIERITEILPIVDDEYLDKLTDKLETEYYRQMTRRHMFKTVDIITFENGRYVMKNMISKKTQRFIRYSLTKEEQKDFSQFLLKWRGCY